MQDQVSCPRCRARLLPPAAGPAGQTIPCPHCDNGVGQPAPAEAPWWVQPPLPTPPPPALSPPPPAAEAPWWVPPPPTPTLALPAPPLAPPARTRRAPVRALRAAGVLLALGAAASLLLVCLTGDEPGAARPAPQEAPEGPRQQAQAPDAAPVRASAVPAAPPRGAAPVKPLPPDEPPPPKPAVPAEPPAPAPKPAPEPEKETPGGPDRAAPPAREQTTVDRAVQRGAAALRKLQRADGTWPHPDLGATALAALTLLECGAARDDAAVQKAARAVRRRLPALTHTYSLALAVLLLDRLDEEADVPFVEALALRLLAGQNAAGGWSYHCPAPSAAEARRLKKLAKDPPPAPAAAKGKAGTRALSQEAEQQLAALRKAPPLAGLGDASNTHFAVLGLWAARRYGVPLDEALARVQVRLGQSRQADGGWGYLPLPGGAAVKGVKLVGGPGAGPNAGAVKKEKVTVGVINLDHLVMRRICELGLAPYLAPPPALAFVQRHYSNDSGRVIAVLWVWGKSPFRSRWDYYPPTTFDFCATILPNNEQIRTATGSRYGSPYAGPRVTPQQMLALARGAWQPIQISVCGAAMEVKAEVARANGDAGQQPAPLVPVAFAGPPAPAPPVVSVVSQGETGVPLPTTRPGGSSPAMTASALFALAICQATARDAEPKPPPADPLEQTRARAVQEGLALLASAVGTPDKAPPLAGRHAGYYTLWALQQTASA
jgi:hypothetical protein